MSEKSNVPFIFFPTMNYVLIFAFFVIIFVAFLIIKERDFWRIGSFKWLYDCFGLSRRMVFLRSLGLTFLAFLSAGTFTHLFYLLNGQGLMMLGAKEWGAFLVATYWGIYLALDKEYTSKYSRLADLHDKELCSISSSDFTVSFTENLSDLDSEDEYFIQTEYLNFATDCLIYKLHRDKSFKSTFRRTIGVLYVVKKHSEDAFDALLAELPILKKHVEEWGENDWKYCLKLKTEKSKAKGNKYLKFTL